MRKTGTEKVFSRLVNGQELTTGQIRKITGLTNVHNTVYHLRKEGHTIYTNKKTLRNGRTVFSYRLGRPNDQWMRHMEAGRTILAQRTLHAKATGVAV